MQNAPIDWGKAPTTIPEITAEIIEKKITTTEIDTIKSVESEEKEDATGRGDDLHMQRDIEMLKLQKEIEQLYML